VVCGGGGCEKVWNDTVTMVGSELGARRGGAGLRMYTCMYVGLFICMYVHYPDDAHVHIMAWDFPSSLRTHTDTMHDV
jgi:hypothetical protein